MRYMKQETENAVGCLSAVFWPLAIPMILFGLIFREKHSKPYADAQVAKERAGKHTKKRLIENSNIDPWELPSEKAPWEK